MRDVAGALVGILLEIPGQRTVTLVLDGEVLGDVSLSFQVCTHGVGRKRYLWSLQIGCEVVGTIGLDGPCTLILVVALTDDTYGKQHYQTLYVRLPDLLIELSDARRNDSYDKVLKKYTKPALLIIDEWLLLPLNREQQPDIFEILTRR